MIVEQHHSIKIMRLGLVEQMLKQTKDNSFILSLKGSKLKKQLSLWSWSVVSALWSFRLGRKKFDHLVRMSSYHEECIMSWLDRSNALPSCRSPISDANSMFHLTLFLLHMSIFFNPQVARGSYLCRICS
jgi:hypothetical protein